jgi:hypothetical protein
MIKNDNQLAIVREQLATAEAALDAIRREVQPQNPGTYAVMAEPYIDVVLSLRAEIDAYLGISAQYQEISGVIGSVDLQAQTFVLRERADGEPDLPCEYSAELAEAVKEHLGNRVHACGRLEVSQKTQKSKLSVDNLVPIAVDEPKAAPSA